MKSTPIKAFVLVMALAAGWLVSMASAQNEATTTPVASSPTTTAAPTTTTAGTTATTSAATATPAAASRAAAGPDSAARGPGAPTENAEDLPEEEECEEAWDYIEFLKTKIKEKIEKILQGTLFQPQSLLETTVADAMSQVLEIRDDVLQRTKSIRTGDESIKICDEQSIKQEEFLAELRMDIMGVLLKLIEPTAARPDKLQEVGRQLLAIRTKVNGKITQLIMLRESRAGSATTSTDDCECGILTDVFKGLESAIASADKDDKGNSSDVDPVSTLTMTLMMVDSRIGLLYNQILGQLDEAKRKESADELQTLKEISRALDEILSEISGEKNQSKVKRVLSRDALRLKNEVEQLLNKCRELCNECESCGSEKIDEIIKKLEDYNITLQTVDEEDAKDSIRSDLMSYLATLNEDMRKLLTAKVQSGNSTLEGCDKETLDVINSIKGPLWMLVNVTIFGDVNTMGNMIGALDDALKEMREKFCASEKSPAPQPTEDNQCDLEEINSAGNWIAEIDKIISENLFKTNDEATKGRMGAMLGFVELKSAMDDRVRQLFSENLVCREEVEQIKNIYSEQVTKCLAEMMSPKYKFEDKTRAERVQCIKQLRVIIEDRRGELLMREIERRIKENSVESAFPDGDTTAVSTREGAVSSRGGAGA